MRGFPFVCWHFNIPEKSVSSKQKPYKQPDIVFKWKMEVNKPGSVGYLCSFLCLWLCPCCEGFSDPISSGSWDAAHLHLVLYQRVIIGNYLFIQKHNYYCT